MQKNPDFIVFFLNLKHHDQYLVPEGQQLYCRVITLKSHVHIEALIKRWNLIGLIYKQKDEKEENFTWKRVRSDPGRTLLNKLSMRCKRLGALYSSSESDSFSNVSGFVSTIFVSLFSSLFGCTTTFHIVIF